MSLASLCNVTATIERKTTTLGTAGAHTDTFASAYTGVIGSLQPIRGDTARRFDRMSMQVSHVFYTPTAIDLVAGDRLVIDSVRYIVKWFENQAGRNRVYAAYLLRTD